MHFGLNVTWYSTFVVPRLDACVRLDGRCDWMVTPAEPGCPGLRGTAKRELMSAWLGRRVDRAGI